MVVKKNIERVWNERKRKKTEEIGMRSCEKKENSLSI
jgi:hypothetical protein